MAKPVIYRSHPHRSGFVLAKSNNTKITKKPPLSFYSHQHHHIHKQRSHRHKYRRERLRSFYVVTCGVICCILILALLAAGILIIMLNMRRNTVTETTARITTSGVIRVNSTSRNSTSLTSLTTTSVSSITSTSTTASGATTETTTTPASTTTTTTTTSTTTTTTSTTTTATTSTTTIITTTTIGSLLWNGTGITIAGTTSTTGTASNLLNLPYGLVLDSTNALYISDNLNNRVQKWLAGASSGTTVAGQSGGGWGTTSADLLKPAGLIIDSSNNLYITDSNNHRIQRWANGASSATTIAGTGSPGSANNQLHYPYDVSRDPSSGTIYIADSSNNRIMQYLSGASSGTVAAGGNGVGTGPTQLHTPYSVCFDSTSNSLFIANYGAHTIVRWALGGTSWTLVAGVTSVNGFSSMNLYSPQHVRLDYASNVYVADTGNHRIQLFLAGQSNGSTIAGVTSVAGPGLNNLNTPYALALDAQLNLYVADSNNHRIQKFMRI